MRLREKNVANLADKKKTLEITALFCRVLVRHVADKEPGNQRSESKSQRRAGLNANWKMGKIQNGKGVGGWNVEPVRKCVAVLGGLAALQDSSGNFEVFKTARWRPWGSPEAFISSNRSLC
jgi:hypothetical protein